MTLSRQIVHAVNAIPTPVGHGISAGQLLGHNQGINTQGMIYIVPVSGAAQTLQASTAEIVGNDVTLSANSAFTMPVASGATPVRDGRDPVLGTGSSDEYHDDSYGSRIGAWGAVQGRVPYNNWCCYSGADGDLWGRSRGL